MPWGPVNLEIIRRTMNHQIWNALFFSIGAAIGDGIWPVIAFVGVSPLLTVRWVELLFWSVSTVVMVILLFAIWRTPLHHEGKKGVWQLVATRKRIALFSGLLLVVTNPLGLGFWLTLLGIGAAHGWRIETTLSAAWAVWGAVALGSLLLYGSVIIVTFHTHRVFQLSRFHTRIRLVFLSILLLITLFFAYHTLNLFFT